MSADRDLKMGRALASIPLPELSEEYYSRIAGILEQVHPVSSRVRGRSRILRMALVAATVAAAAAAVAFAVLPALRGTDTATAADVLASMSAGGDAKCVRVGLEEGILRTPEEGGPPVFLREITEDLVLSVTGDYRGRQRWYVNGPLDAPKVIDFGYDVARRETRTTGGGDGLQVHRPSWLVDQSSLASEYIDYNAVGGSVRALLAELDPETPVSQTTYLGRPAWRATLESVWPGMPGTSVVVDKATGLLLEMRREAGGGEDVNANVLRVTRLEENPALHANWQVVPLLKKPTGELNWNYFQDDGTRFGSPEAVAKRSWPTLPLIPTSVPDGYRRAGVANAVWWEVREKHMNDDPWKWKTETVRRPGRRPGLSITKRLALGGCPQGVLVLFRRGFQSFTVEISPRLPGDPGLGRLEAEQRTTMQETVLTGGYLKGARARTWISSAMLPVTHLYPNSMMISHQGPTLLAYSDRSLVAVYGDLTRQELIDVASSFEVYGDVERPLPADYMK